MSELFEQDLTPLAPQEIERLLKQSRDAGFQLDENAPRKQRGDFKKSNLIEIARAVSDEKDAETPPSPDEKASGEVTPENEASVSQTTSSAREDKPNETDSLAVEAEQFELTHEEVLNKAFEDGKSRGYEDGLKAGRTEGKEQGKDLGRTEGMAEGKVEGGNEAEARLSAQVSALEKLITNTINSETLDAGYLRNLLGQKIAELASERAGSEIAIAPEGFSEKIEKLLDTVSHATETPFIFLNGTDYQSVAHLLIRRDSLKKASIQIDSSLQPGDLRIQIGHIGLEDRLTQRLGLEASETEPEAKEKLVEIGETLQKLLDDDADQSDEQPSIEFEKDQEIDLSDSNEGEESSDE
jgi:flagellar assembly protein FliH